MNNLLYAYNNNVRRYDKTIKAGYKNTCLHVQAMWDAYRAKCDWHESYHEKTEFVNHVVKKVKLRKGEVKYCQCTAPNVDIPQEYLEMKEKLEFDVFEEYKDCYNKFMNDSTFDNGPGRINFYTFFTDTSHSITAPCGRP